MGYADASLTSCMQRRTLAKGSLKCTCHVDKASVSCCSSSLFRSAAAGPHPARVRHHLQHRSGISFRHRHGVPYSSQGQLSWRKRYPSRLVLRAVSTEVLLEEEFSADNFYEILGVSPMASQKDIKRAYYNMMKDFHPDLSGDEESTEFCTLLNDIYQTLMDPERRATYDALAGFSANSINPFADTTLPADQVFVDEFTCIGCRNCTNVCPNSFAIEDDYGRARVMTQGVDTEAKLQEAIDTCPVNCISWVTASQLSLLEAAMSKMERVAVWSLMSGGGGGRDVFTEASMAWEKRQAAVRAKLQQQQAESAWSAWMSNIGASAAANWYSQAAEAAKRAEQARRASASSSYSSYDDSDNTDGAYSSDEDVSFTKEGARIAKLAAKAARASRQWKSWQELQQRGRQAANGFLLTASVSSSDD